MVNILFDCMYGDVFKVKENTTLMLGWDMWGSFWDFSENFENKELNKKQGEYLIIEARA